MATMPTPGGSLSITGDPALEQSLAAIQGQVMPQQTQDQLSPTAQRWANHWTPKPYTMMSPRYGYRSPGTPGFGVLSEQSPGGKGTRSLKQSPDFIVNRQQGGKQGSSLRGTDTLTGDRTKLQGIADAILGRPASPSELGELWGWALEQIDAAEVMGSDPKDPWHWLDMRRAQEEADLAEKNGPSTTTQTQRTINLTDPTTAGAVIDQTLRNLLGRRASDEEREQFMSTLRATEQANPTITTMTSTSTPSADGMDQSVDSSSTTTGGAPDPGTAAQAYADDELMGEQKAMLAASYYEALRGL